MTDNDRIMYEKGYLFRLEFIDRNLPPLYAKTIKQASQLMREWKDDHFRVWSLINRKDLNHG